jgi:ribosome biogenesis GTPase A
MTDRSAPAPSYDAVRERLARLSGLARRQRVLAEAEVLNLGRQLPELDALEVRVGSDSFRILVVGEFKRGKSTLINAMLGDKVLPAFATPTTAVISEVKWGETPRAVLYPAGPDGAGQADPLEVPIASLADHISIDEDGDSRHGRYERAEISWPLGLCRDGVVLTDTPGLNEDPDRERITVEQLKRADAVVFVSDSQANMGILEKTFIEARILPLGHEAPFFVCNKIDLVEPEERERVIRVSRRKLGPYTRPNRVFFVDARRALLARLAGDAAELEESNLPAVEASLEGFLAGERGTSKVAGPARELKHFVDEARMRILERRAMLAMDADDVQRRCDQAKQSLGELERQHAAIVEQASHHLADVVLEVQESARQLLLALADRCGAWAEEMEELEHRLSVSPFKVQERAEAAAREVSTFIGQQLQVEVARWQQHELEPLLERRTAELEAKLGDNLRSFVRRADQVRFELTSIEASVAVEGENISALERVLAGAAGAVLFGIGSSYSGGRFGFKALLRGALPQMAVLIAGIALGFGPILLTLSLLGSDLLRTTLQVDRLSKKLKEQVAAAAADELRQRAVGDAAALAKTATDTLVEMRDALSSGLTAQLDGIRDQVAVALAEKQASDADVGRRLAELAGLEREAEEIDSVLDALTANAGSPAVAR